MDDLIKRANQTGRCIDEARAAATVYEACAEALLNVPGAGVVSDVSRVAALLGSDVFHGCGFNDALEQRYYDRFFVSSSPWFVPLNESCIRGMRFDDGIRRFGSTADARTDHVVACYRVAGFNVADLRGYDLAVRLLRSDSLAAELAFMAYLARREADATSADTREHCRQMQTSFLKQHLARWASLAAKVLAERDDDFYARVVALAAAWIEIDQ